MNKGKLNQIVDHYYKNFDTNWLLEDYKWKEVLKFQKNWNLESDDFVAMLKTSVNESSNLLASRNYFPINEIIKVSKERKEEVRKAFRLLFDEEQDLNERILSFASNIKELKKSLGFESQDGSDLRFISTMLFLKYPNKYSIYKYSDLIKFSEELETHIEFKKGRVDSIRKVKTLIHLIRNHIVQNNHDVIKVYVEKLNDSEYYYKDESLLMLAQNVFWYAARTYDHLKELDDYIPPIIKIGRLRGSEYAPKVHEKGIKTDYDKKSKKDKALGKSGESFVLEFEHNKLKGTGYTPEWVSENQGDGLGFDILSYDLEGNEIYIEVKTTSFDENTLFFITATELAAAKKHGKRYFLYRLYKFGSENKISIYSGDMVQNLCSTPHTYAVLGTYK